MYRKIFRSMLSLLCCCAAPLQAQDAHVDNSYELDEVVVSATRMQLPVKNMPQKVEIIDAAKIASLQAGSVAELLKRTVNLDIIEYPGASAAVGMRGFAPSAHNRNYTLVLIDGKPAGTTNLTSIPTDFIERVEVVKGPYSVLYGSDAMGGVINIVTRPVSRQPAGSVAVSAGNFGQTLFNGYASGALSQRSAVSFGFSRKAQDKDYRIGTKNLLHISGFDKLILDKKSFGDVMTNTQYQINQFVGKADYRISDLWQAALTGIFVTSDDIEMPGNYWHSEGLSKKDFNRNNLMLDLSRKSSANRFLFSPYFSQYNESNYNNDSDDAFINSKESVKQYGFKLSDSQISGNFQWVGGVDLDAMAVSSERFSDKITQIDPYRPDHSSLALSAFVQGAYSAGKIFVNAGIRYSFTNFTLEADNFLKNERKSTGYSNFNPSMGIKYFVSPAFNLHASAGNAFYVPDAYKVAGIYSVGKLEYRGNPGLKPETSVSFDAGASISAGKVLNADVTFFHTLYRNKIVDDSQNNAYISYKNAGKGRMNGVEIILSTVPAKLFETQCTLAFHAAFTHLFDDSFDDRDDKGNILTKEMLYVRRNTGNFAIAFDSNAGFASQLSARYIGKRLENDWMVWGNLRPEIAQDDHYAKGGYTTSDPLKLILQHPAHLVFDYSACYNVTPKARIGISVANLLDENYTEKDGYNMPGRSILGSFAYSF